MFRKNIVLQSWKPVVWCMPMSVQPELNRSQKLRQSAQPVAWKHRNVYPGENTQIHWVLETMRSKEGSQARVLWYFFWAEVQRGQQNGVADKGAWHQGWRPEFNPWDLRGGGRKQAPQCCPLASACTAWNACVYMCALTITSNKWIKS